MVTCLNYIIDIKRGSNSIKEPIGFTGIENCNVVNGNYSNDGNKISFTNINISEKYCTPLYTEYDFRKILKRTTTFHINSGKNETWESRELILFDQKYKILTLHEVILGRPTESLLKNGVWYIVLPSNITVKIIRDYPVINRRLVWYFSKGQKGKITKNTKRQNISKT